MKRKVCDYKSIEDIEDCLCTLICSFESNSINYVLLFTYINMLTNTPFNADSTDEEHVRFSISEVIDKIMFNFNNADVTSRYEKF